MMLPPLAAEIIGHFGSFPVSNSFMSALLASAILLIACLALIGKNAAVPRGFQNLCEAILEMMLEQAEKVTGSREKALKILPLAGTIFLFVLLNNWLGLVPGVGSIGVHGMHNGKEAFLPLFRSAASDLNLTIALAVLSVVAANIMGAAAVGFMAHIGKFLNFKGFVHAFHEKGIGGKLVGLFVAVVELFVGFIEIISEIAKVFSLSLRLFGNVFAGEVLLAVMAGLLSFGLPIPFMVLELLVGIIQASVFAMLVLVYATVAMDEPHGAKKEEPAAHH